jgi:hypothetical protein
MLPIAPSQQEAIDLILEFPSSDDVVGESILRKLRQAKKSRFPIPRSVSSTQREIRELLTRVLEVETWPDTWYVLAEFLPFGGIPLDELEIEDLDDGDATIYSDPSCRKFSEWAAVYLMTIVDSPLFCRLHQCSAQDCERFFLDWPSKRGRPRKKFCSRRCADRERQRQYRSWRK